MVNNISCVILAGGASKRLGGRMKSKIIIGGETILSRIHHVVNEIFDEVIIVTNTPDEFSDYSNCLIVTDEFRQIGPLGGIHSAFKASTKEALFVFAGDMPLLDKSIISNQIKLFNKTKCDILTPRIGRYIEPLHSIYNGSLLITLEKFISAEHSYAVRDFLSAVNVNYLELPETENSREAFFNINSPADIITAERILANRR